MQNLTSDYKPINIIQLISNKVWGGGERYAHDLSTRLRHDGFYVHAITRGYPVVDNRLTDSGIPVSKAPFNGLFDFKTPRVICDVAMQLPADIPLIIHAHDFKNALLAIRAKHHLKKLGRNAWVVVTRHLVKRAKSDLLNRYVYRNIDSLIFPSKIVRNEFLSSNPAIDSKKLHLVYNSIFRQNNSIIHHNKTKKDLSSPVVISFLGRFSPEKGIELLFDSLAMIKDLDWRLRMCGTGHPEYEKSLHQHAEDLGISDRVEWPGFIEDINSVISSTDIGVMPSICREAFGLTILEFISAGIPVVATDRGGQTEILTTGKDSVLSPAEPGEFSLALRKVIEDPALRARLGAEASATARRFDYETFYKGILESYRQAIAL